MTASTRWAVSLFAGAVLLGACGVRTSPLVGRAHPRDAGVRDAHIDAPDVPRRDLGVDLYVASTPCEADRDCGRDTVCRASTSIPPMDLALVSLFCEARTPMAAADGDACEGRDGSGCGRGLCVIAGTCVVPCASQADCAPGQRCAGAFVRTGPTALQPVRACTDIVVAPPAVSRRVDTDVAVSLGGFAAFDASIARSSPTTLAMFTAQSGEELFLQALRDPAGNALFDSALLGPGLPAQVNPVNPSGVALTVLMPSGGDVAAGDYSAELLTDGPGAVDRIVLERAATGRVLDLDLYFVAGRLTGSVDAPINPELRRALEAFRTVYAGMGIAVAEVRTHELVGALARRYASLEMDVDGRLPETDTLFALTAGARSPSVAWFFVRDAEGVLGLSGGVPGAQCMPGTAASGVVISGDLLGSGVPLESVLIHETAHFLGLFHTSEFDGSVLDPFADTPSCGPDRDADGNGYLLPDECIGAGADNVMFWAGTDARVLSASQRRLVARALLLR